MEQKLLIVIITRTKTNAQLWVVVKLSKIDTMPKENKGQNQKQSEKPKDIERRQIGGCKRSNERRTNGVKLVTINNIFRK
jgi:1,2-phenylacetyl-CoA epoxidase PaaB subunit